MSSIRKNLKAPLTLSKQATNIVVVQSEYNAGITDKLTVSCIDELKKAGAKKIELMKVPGAWELPFGCHLAAKKKPDAIIAVGCIIKGETPHFDFIAKAVSSGIMSLSLAKGIPIMFGVLTTLNEAQAKARTKGGKRGDKGIEIAQAAISMLNLKP